MAAGAGFKTFVTGDVLTAADTNGYLMQGVWVFANAAARDAAVTSPQEGNFCYLKDTDALQYYSGSAWAAKGGAATFVGVNATRTNVSTAVTANTEILVAFTTEEFDTNGFHDNSTNNSRLTIPAGYAGKYIVAAYCNNPNTPGSYQLLRLFKNGSLYTTGGVYGGEYVRNSTGSGNTAFGFSQTITTAAADYWEIKYQQNSTETVNMYFNFQLTYVGA